MGDSLWDYRDTSWQARDISGYKVEATDGGIGKVDETSNEVGAGYIVVDTGPWILGKKVMLPAGVIERVDHEDEQVHVSLTKDQIKGSPEFDESSYREREYRDQLGGYYGDAARWSPGPRNR